MAAPAKPLITSASAPDVAQVKTWLEEMIAALKFAELVAAILALITRLRDLNTQLTLQLAQHRKVRSKSEKLVRVDQQLGLHFGLQSTKTAPA